MISKDWVVIENQSEEPFQGAYRAIRGGVGYYSDRDAERGFDVTGFITHEDAALMRAAPELLDALEDVLDALTNWMEIAEEHDERESDMEAVIKARAAIAKATGEPQTKDDYEHPHDQKGELQ